MKPWTQHGRNERNFSSKGHNTEEGPTAKTRWMRAVCMTKVTWNRKGWNLPVIPGTLRNSSNIPNPIYNLNKHEFHAQFAHVDFVWAPFSHRSDTLVLGIKPRWSSPNLRPLYWRLAPADSAAAKFFTWGLKSSSSDLCHSAPGSVSAQRSPVTCRLPGSNTTNAF